MADSKQTVMVLQKEEKLSTRAMAPAAASPAMSSFLKALRARPNINCGRPQEKQPGNDMNTSPQLLTASQNMTTSAISTDSNPHPENLAAEVSVKGVTVTLDNNSMWNEFFRCTTEMILTKQGRRMFPSCRYRVSGMEPFQSYLLVMDIVPVDDYRYRWTDHRWEPSEKSEPHASGRIFIHPESPANGHYWMQNPVSFYKLKLSNNVLNQEGHVVLHSMHRYLPRLHIVPADKQIDGVDITRPDVMTFSFPQTEFFAVTAYQNLSITQLKIDYNPFAKGFREDAGNCRSFIPKLGPTNVSLESESKNKELGSIQNGLKAMMAKKVSADKGIKHPPFPAVKLRDLELKDHINIQPFVVLERCVLKRRPSTLSELFQGAPLKLKKTTAENDFLCSTKQKVDTDHADQGSLKDPGKESELQGQNEVAKPSFAAEGDGKDRKSTKDSKASSEDAKSQPSVCQVLDAEFSSGPFSIFLKNEPKDCSFLPKETSSATKQEDNFKTSQNKSGPSKRPSAKALPLLALFFQQLKSKTKPVSGNPKADDQVISEQVKSKVEQPIKNTIAVDETVLTDSSFTGVMKLDNTSSSELHSIETPALTSCLETLNILSDPLSASKSEIMAPELTRLTQSMNNVTPDLTRSTEGQNIVTPDLTSSKESHNIVAPDVMDTSASYNTIMPDLTSSSDLLNDMIHDLEDCSESQNILTSDLTGSTESPTITPDLMRSTESHEGLADVQTPTPLTSLFHLKTDVYPSLNAPLDHSTLLGGVAENIGSSHMQTCSASSDKISFSTSAFCDTTATPTTKSDGMEPLFSAASACGDPDFDDITASLSPLISESGAPLSSPGSPFFSALSPFSPAPFEQEPVDVPESPPDSPLVAVKADACQTSSRTGVASLVISCSSQGSVPKEKPLNKGRKSKLESEEPAFGARLQPSLEDVEGQLFVSFTSKKALSNFLGDDAVETQAPPSEETSNIVETKAQEPPKTTTADIGSLEVALLQDLKVMKHRQVIHPVLQEVGLKLNILDQILAVDLAYLGVELPIPPPFNNPGENIEAPSSSQFAFISRTGKTTDVTKIKGWREKFVPSNSKESQPEAATNVDAPAKNLSAFCSDMLDEYLASEGKLIDERAASFSTSTVIPVAYQMPTKSSSYVRTLDSVLKKRTPSGVSTTTTPMSSNTSSSASSQAKKNKKAQKDTQKPAAAISRKPFKTANTKGAAPAPQPTPPTSEAKQTPASSSKKTSSGLKTTKKTQAPAPVSTTPAPAPRTVATENSPAKTPQSKNDTPVSQGAGGASDSRTLLPTVLKLLEVEEGAVWAGKECTFITKERASISLAALASKTGLVRENPQFLPIIKHRAPPCLQPHCRLGCVCPSLAQERRQVHCGKPECMLRCSCLRHRMLRLKKPKVEEEEDVEAEELMVVTEEEDDAVTRKKRRKERGSYVLVNSSMTSEPASHPRRLWNSKSLESGPDELRIPTPVYLPCRLRYDNETYKEHLGYGQHCATPHEMTLSSARVRPFVNTKRKAHHGEAETPAYSSDETKSTQGLEPGEYTISGPSKRLEVVTECKWDRRTDRAFIMRVLCDHMDKDRLKTPFWIGKYRIQPISQSIVDEGLGPCINYKVQISQPGFDVLKDKIINRGEAHQAVCTPEENTLNQEEVVQLQPAPPVIKPPQGPEVTMSLQKPTVESELCSRIVEPSTSSSMPSLPNSGAVESLKPSNASMDEELPNPKPETVLPFLSGVPSAGMLTAQVKSQDGCSITVNGKSYPKARLQLGQIGALHPANRLAAYITGKVDPAHLPGVSKAQAEIIVKNLGILPVPTTSTVTPGTTTTTSNSSSAFLKPTVTKPKTGTIYTQFVASQLGSQQKLLSTSGAQGLVSTPKPVLVSVKGSPVDQAAPAKQRIIVTMPPSKQVLQKSLVGSTLSSITTPIVTMTTAAGRSTDGRSQAQNVLKIIASSPLVRGASSATTGSGSIAVKGGNRVFLQPVRTASGVTLYRNASGQLVTLVPLSQLRSINPNLVLKDQKAFVRLPCPLLPQSSTTESNQTARSSSVTDPPIDVSPITPLTSSSAATSVVNQKPVNTNAGAVTVTTTKPATNFPSLCGSSMLSVKSSSASKVAPEFLGDSGTHTVRIVPGGCPGPQSLPLSQGTGKIVPTKGAFTLLNPPDANTPQPGNESEKNQEAPKMTDDHQSTIVPKLEAISEPVTTPSLSHMSEVFELGMPQVVKVSTLSPGKASAVFAHLKTQKDGKDSGDEVHQDSPAAASQVTSKPTTSSSASDRILHTKFKGCDNSEDTHSQERISTMTNTPCHNATCFSHAGVDPEQDGQKKSNFKISVMGTVWPETVVFSDEVHKTDSSLDGLVHSSQMSLTSSPKVSPSQDKNTSTVEASTENLGQLECPVSTTDRQPGPEMTGIDDDDVTDNSDPLDMAPLSDLEFDVENDIDIVNIDSGEDSDLDCVFVSDKRVVIQGGDISSDTEAFETVILTDNSGVDSDDDDDCVSMISESGNTDVSGDEDGNGNSEALDKSTMQAAQPHVTAQEIENISQTLQSKDAASSTKEKLTSEKRLRNELNRRFNQLKDTLDVRNPRAPKVDIIIAASKEIQRLRLHESLLEHEKNLLRKRQKMYLRDISQSSGKSEESILKNLQDLSQRLQIIEQRNRKPRKSNMPHDDVSLSSDLLVQPPKPSSEASPVSSPEKHASYEPLQPARRPKLARQPKDYCYKRNPFQPKDCAPQRTNSPSSSVSSHYTATSNHVTSANCTVTGQHATLHKRVPTSYPSSSLRKAVPLRPGSLSVSSAPVTTERTEKRIKIIPNILRKSSRAPTVLNPLPDPEPSPVLDPVRNQVLHQGISPGLGPAQNLASNPAPELDSLPKPAVLTIPSQALKAMPNLMNKSAPDSGLNRVCVQVFNSQTHIAPNPGADKATAKDTSLLTVMNPLIPVQQIISLNNPLRPLYPMGNLVNVPVPRPNIPGVATFSIRLPPGSRVIQVAKAPSTVKMATKTTQEVETTAYSKNTPEAEDIDDTAFPMTTQKANIVPAYLTKTPETEEKAAHQSMEGDVTHCGTDVKISSMCTNPGAKEKGLPDVLASTSSCSIITPPFSLKTGIVQNVPSSLKVGLITTSTKMPELNFSKDKEDKEGLTVNIGGDDDDKSDDSVAKKTNMAATGEKIGDAFGDGEADRNCNDDKGSTNRDEQVHHGNRDDGRARDGPDGEGEDKECERVGEADGDTDPSLMSLLSEIAFLNQQSRSDRSKPTTPGCSTPSEQAESGLESAVGGVTSVEDCPDRPFVLRLEDDDDDGEEDFDRESTDIKSVYPETPQMFASSSVKGPLEQSCVKTGPAPVSPTITTIASNGEAAAVAVKGDAPIPPPLLQMKAGVVAPTIGPVVQEELSWRPMPKLVPLGLKTVLPPSTNCGAEQNL